MNIFSFSLHSFGALCSRI